MPAKKDVLPLIKALKKLYPEHVIPLHHGNAWELLCAVIFSVHILVIDRFAPQVDAVRLSCLQFFVGSLWGAVLMALFDLPTLEELRAWHAASGLPLKRFFNTSGIPYREQGLSKKLPDMSEDEQLALLATDGMLVKRPLVIGEGVVLTGFREEEWAERLLKTDDQ